MSASGAVTNPYRTDPFRELAEKAAATTMEASAASGDWDVFKFKLSALLNNAIARGDAAGVDALLSFFNSGGNEYNLTPLHKAAQKQDYKTVLKLLEANADPNVQDHSALATPLYWAINLNYPTEEGKDTAAKIATLLLARGADPNLANGRVYAEFPLYTAILRFRKGPKLLELVGKLLDAGADPNSVNQTGQTPLLAAIDKGNVAVAELLLKRGADVQKKRGPGTDIVRRNDPTTFVSDECFPIGRAAQVGNPDMIALLMRYGANVNAPDSFGETPLMAAINPERRSTKEMAWKERTPHSFAIIMRDEGWPYQMVEYDTVAELLKYNPSLDERVYKLAEGSPVILALLQSERERRVLMELTQKKDDAPMSGLPPELAEYIHSQRNRGRSFGDQLRRELWEATTLPDTEPPPTGSPAPGPPDFEDEV